MNQAVAHHEINILGFFPERSNRILLFRLYPNCFFTVLFLLYDENGTNRMPLNVTN